MQTHVQMVFLGVVEGQGLNRLDGVHWGNMGSTDLESLCCQLA